MAATVHLLKLCVGADVVEDLIAWQADRMAERQAAGGDPRPFHVTRMWPKRADALVDGGSLYWVFRGRVLARQRILGLEPRRGADGIERCAIRLDAAGGPHRAAAAPAVPGLALPAARGRAGRPRHRRGVRRAAGADRRARRDRSAVPMRLFPPLAAAALAVLAAAPAGAVSRFNWDALGDEFCRLTLAGDLAGLRPLLTVELQRAIEAAVDEPGADAAAGAVPDL